MKISILTPTYNRADLLDKLYTSIVINNNNCQCDIEWLIMDDGSTDNTKQIVQGYINQKIIDVQYYYEENKGKMSAINELVNHSTGDYIIECDSDDFFDPTAFEVMEKTVQKCKDVENIYAYVFLKYDQNGENMGNDFPEDGYISTMFDLYYKKKVYGEKALLFNGNIRRRYEYILEEDEKFVTEARLYHKLDLDYKVMCFNNKVMICEYQKDGYTKNINKQFIENPKGYYEFFKEIFDQNMRGVTLKKRLYVYKHYILFCVLNNKKNITKDIPGLWNKIMIRILYLPGKIKTRRKFKIKKKTSKE